MWRHQTFIFALQHFSIFMTTFQKNMMKNLAHQSWHELVHNGPRYGHMNRPYAISPNWNHQCTSKLTLFTTAMKAYEPGQFTLISVGLIRYSCGHISGPHEQISTKFELWIFFIILHWYMVFKMLKCPKKVLYSVIQRLVSQENAFEKSRKLQTNKQTKKHCFLAAAILFSSVKFIYLIGLP